MQKIVLTCEHGGNFIPVKYAGYFAAGKDLLNSHRGWDPGALELFQKYVAAGVDASFFSETSRLLVELNRSLHHPNLFSALAKKIPAGERQQILATHYEPYRSSVEETIRSFTAQNHSVLHLSVHSFTPELNGEKRNAAIGLLYDPQRQREKEFCARWKTELLQTYPELRVRFNYPYRGTADGFTTSLRKQFTDAQYAGVELEVNQQFPLGGGAAWAALQQVLVTTFFKAACV